MSENRRAVFDCLDLAERPMPPKEVAEVTELGREQVKKLLRRMLRDGGVTADGNGRYQPVRR